MGWVNPVLTINIQHDSLADCRGHIVRSDAQVSAHLVSADLVQVDGVAQVGIH